MRIITPCLIEWRSIRRMPIKITSNPARLLVPSTSTPSRTYQHWLDRSVIYPAWRWGAFFATLLVFLLRIYVVEGWYIVTYGLGIFLLNNVIGFLSPQVRRGRGAWRRPRSVDYTRETPQWSPVSLSSRSQAVAALCNTLYCAPRGISPNLTWALLQCTCRSMTGHASALHSRFAVDNHADSLMIPHIYCCLSSPPLSPLLSGVAVVASRSRVSCSPPQSQLLCSFMLLCIFFQD